MPTISGTFTCVLSKLFNDLVCVVDVILGFEVFSLCLHYSSLLWQPQDLNYGCQLHWVVLIKSEYSHPFGSHWCRNGLETNLAQWDLEEVCMGFWKFFSWARERPQGEVVSVFSRYEQENQES